LLFFTNGSTCTAYDSGRPILFMLSDPAAFGGALAIVLATRTKQAATAVGEWTHIAATFNGSHSIMAVNGVPALVQSGLPCDGSIYCKAGSLYKLSAVVTHKLESAWFQPSSL
jgi:hypothetical protein